MVTIKDGAIICPRCAKKIRCIRVGPDSVARRVNLQCQFCKHNFDIDIQPGQRRQGQRH